MDKKLFKVEPGPKSHGSIFLACQGQTSQMEIFGWGLASEQVQEYLLRNENFRKLVLADIKKFGRDGREVVVESLHYLMQELSDPRIRVSHNGGYARTYSLV